jgi:hypothetical protein
MEGFTIDMPWNGYILNQFMVDRSNHTRYFHVGRRFADPVLHKVRILLISLYLHFERAVINANLQNTEKETSCRRTVVLET